MTAWMPKLWYNHTAEYYSESEKDRTIHATHVLKAIGQVKEVRHEKVTCLDLFDILKKAKLWGQGPDRVAPAGWEWGRGKDATACGAAGWWEDCLSEPWWRLPSCLLFSELQERYLKGWFLLYENYTAIDLSLQGDAGQCVCVLTHTCVKWRPRPARRWWAPIGGTGSRATSAVPFH